MGPWSAEESLNSDCFDERKDDAREEGKDGEREERKYGSGKWRRMNEESGENRKKM